MAWKTLSLHFQQSYEGAYRYLDKCGQFMVEATKETNCITTEAKPIGAKMEIPESGVHITADCISLMVWQELPVDDGAEFLRLCKVLADLATKNFEPKTIFRNGFLWKSYTAYTNAADMLKASLQYGGAFHTEVGKVVGMLPANKNLDFFLSSGSKDLHILLQPVTFERVKIEKRNIDIRAPKEQQSRIDRLNKFTERIKETFSHALVLDVDLMENDPPPDSLDKHFEELRQKSNQLKKLFESK